MTRIARRILTHFTITILFLALPALAHAATLLVTSAIDDGSPGTLRQVIASANAGDTIEFSPTVIAEFSIIVVTQGPINIDQNLTIAGPQAGATIDASRFNNIFAVGANVSLVNLTLENGATTGAGPGGAIAVSGAGVLTLTNCILMYNSASNGGAIFVSPLGSATLEECTLNNNTAAGSGGAIYVANGGTLNLTNDTFYTNTAALDGGAIFDTLGASLNVVNSTFSQNTATGTSANGGAIYSDGAHITIANSLLAFDTASASTTSEIDSLSSNPNFTPTISVFTSDIYTPGVGVQFGAFDFDPQFLVFRNYGGLVPTLPPAMGSRAFGAGSSTFAPPTDARGFTRPNPPSMGAFDLPFAQALPPFMSPLSGANNTPFTVSFTPDYTEEIIYFTTDDTLPTTSSPVYSGPFNTVGSGTEIIQAIDTAPGYAPSQVTKGTFTITPDAPSYSAGLQLFSSPLDYPGIALDTLFGYTGVKLAVWDPSLSEYDITPNGAAGSVRLGVGYWGRFPQNVTFSSVGAAAPTNVPFTITLKKGWNEIGDPFTVSVPITSLTFGTNNIPFAEASSGSNPVIGAAVYSYDPTANNNAGGYVAASELDPLSGYWIFASAGTTMQALAPL